MTLDKLIEKLLEAKEHCVPGNSNVLIKGARPRIVTYIGDVNYNSNNVYIEI